MRGSGRGWGGAGTGRDIRHHQRSKFTVTAGLSQERQNTRKVRFNVPNSWLVLCVLCIPELFWGLGEREHSRCCDLNWGNTDSPSFESVRALCSQEAGSSMSQQHDTNVLSLRPRKLSSSLKREATR